MVLPGLVLAFAAAALLRGRPATARPVPIGRYTEIPYGVSPDHPWASLAANARRTARMPVKAPRRAPTKRWTQSVGGRAYAPAVRKDGRLFVASASGIVSMTGDGQVQWKRRLGLVTGTPSITPEGDIAVGAEGGELHVLSGQRGTTRVRARVGGAVYGGPLVLADGSLVVAAFDRALHRFDSDGRRLFRTPLPDDVQSPPAWDGRGSLVVTSGNEAQVFSPRGVLERRTVLGGALRAGPVIADDGTIWVLTVDGTLVALGPEGNVTARAQLQSAPSFPSRFALGADGAVRIGTRHALVCIGPTGTERWRIDSEGPFTESVSVDAEDVTLAITQAGFMLAVERDGTVRWRVSTGVRTDATAAVLGPDGTIYVSTYRGRLEAWK
jgi:outer membrane protein assembly factor BamB